MSTQLPAHLQNRRPNALTQAVSQGLSAGSPPSLSIARNRFTLIDAAGNEQALQTMFADVVIVQANPSVSKIYFDVAYDPAAQEYSPPACFSDNGVGASRQASKPQSTNCQTCPHNAWGSNISKVTGKPTKACNDAKKIAIIMADKPNMPFLLRVPPASLKHLAAYARTIAAQSAGTRQVEMSDVVTRVTFDPQVQGVLNFSAVGWIDEQTAAAMEKIWDAKSADDLVGLNDTPYQGPINSVQALPGAAPHPQGQLPPPPQPVGHAPAGSPAAFVPSVPQAEVAPPATIPLVRGRGRPKKVDAAPPASNGQAASLPAFMQGAQAAPTSASQAEPTDGIPAFLLRDQGAPGQAPPANQTRFGMVENAQATNPELDAALARAMNLPLPKG